MREFSLDPRIVPGNVRQHAVSQLSSLRCFTSNGVQRRALNYRPLRVRNGRWCLALGGRRWAPRLFVFPCCLHLRPVSAHAIGPPHAATELFHTSHEQNFKCVKIVHLETCMRSAQYCSLIRITRCVVSHNLGRRRSSIRPRRRQNATGGHSNMRICNSRCRRVRANWLRRFTGLPNPFANIPAGCALGV